MRKNKCMRTACLSMSSGSAGDRGDQEDVMESLLLFAFKWTRSLRRWRRAEVHVGPTRSGYCICLLLFNLDYIDTLWRLQIQTHSSWGGGSKVAGKRADSMKRRGRRTENWRDKNRTIEDIHKSWILFPSSRQKELTETYFSGVPCTERKDHLHFISIISWKLFPY